jgi:hypothetical protein
MIDTSKYLVITKRNWRQYAAVPPGGAYPYEELVPMLQGSTGYKGWQEPGQPHVFCGPSPVSQLIPRSDWVSMIKAGAGTKAFDAIQANGIQAKNQDGLNLCWCYGSTRAVELRRVLSGLPFLSLAPESIDVEVNGGRNVGGYASQAFDAIQTKGICEETFLDAPNSLHPARWKSGWQANAASHEVVNWFNIDGSSGDIYAEVVTCLLQDSPVAAGLSWWGHLINFVAAVLLPDNTVGILFQNSWGVDWPTAGANGLACLTEQMGTPDGAASPVLVIDAPVTPPGPVDPGPPPGPPAE